jgi:hypothetical protein
VPTSDEAAKILEALGLPKAQQKERSALTLLALASLGPKSKWSATKRPLSRTVDIMEFMRARYGKTTSLTAVKISAGRRFISSSKHVLPTGTQIIPHGLPIAD